MNTRGGSLTWEKNIPFHGITKAYLQKKVKEIKRWKDDPFPRDVRWKI
jgi:hypothetical protein